MKAEYVNHWLAIAIIASLLLLPACIFDDDDYTDPLDANGIEGAKESNLDRESLPVKYEPSTVSELIAEGKAALEIRDSLTAHEKFERALYLDPQNSDAACGLVLAGGIRTVDTIGDLIGQLEDPHMPFGKEGGMGDCVQELIRNSLLPILNEMAQAIEIALADPNFSFWLEHYPLFVDGDHALLDMGNEWDAADMIGARGFVLLLMGFSHTILSLEADFNWDTVFHWDFGGKDITDQIIAICDLLITLLSDEDYPDFLKLNEDGYLLLPKAGLEYGHGLRDLGSFYDYVRMETDPQDDDVAGYVDANGNGVWDPDEVLRTPYFGELTPGANITFNLLQHYALGMGASFLDGTEDDIDPDNPNKWNLGELTMLMWNLGLGFQIPDFEIDLGEFYRDPSADGIHTTLLLIATFVKEALEEDGELP